MVKIKKEVKMTFPELIEWGLENGIKSRRFTNNRLNSKYVSFDALGGVYFNNLYSYLLEDTFTVEVEEEITEDTIIPLLLKIYKSGDNASEASIYRSISINTAESSTRSIAYYSINDGGTLTLIWKDGELAGDE